MKISKKNQWKIILSVMLTDIDRLPEKVVDQLDVAYDRVYEVANLLDKLEGSGYYEEERKC